MPDDLQTTSPRIRKISLDGIGPFDGATFEPLAPAGPGELVLFEGPNGSGKTTLLEAVAVLVGGVGRSFGWEKDWVSSSPEQIRQERLRFVGQPQVPGGLLPTVPPVTGLLRRLRSDAPRVEVAFEGAGVASLEVPKLRGVVWQGEGLPRIGEFHQAAALNSPTSWAAFAYRGHVPTANITTDGPKHIERPALRAALSFGEIFPASDELGQILINIYYDQLHAFNAAEQAKGTPDEATFRAAADAHQAALERISRALSDVLQRKVTIHFQFRQRPPEIRLDGEIIPLDLLGEGFRRTLAWLSDLCARLELTPWKDATRSPFDQDFWLLLDEIDQSLHPDLQRHILPTLRRLFPNARIYATTHSPFVVASAPGGCVFSIRPDPSDHRVRGSVSPIRLGPGHSLSWTIEEVFRVPSAFVDEDTVARLEKHKEAVERLRRGEIKDFDWREFAKLRAPLIATEGDGRAIVMLTEHKVRSLIDERLRDIEGGAHEEA